MKNNRRNFKLKLVVLVTFLAMVLVNGLANILPFNGVTTGAVSDSYPNLFAPAGITFSIWGVIYVLLLFYSIYQFGFFQKVEHLYREAMFKKIGIYFTITNILNIVWIFTWHYKLIEISFPIIVVILILLILINKITKKIDLSLKDSFFIRVPFSIYFGWITVATIANATSLLVKRGFGDLSPSPVFWTIAIIIIGLLIGSATIIRNRDIAYGLPVIWAYIGIYLKHVSPEGWNAQYSSIIFTVVASIILLVVVEIYTLTTSNRGDPGIRDI